MSRDKIINNIITKSFDALTKQALPPLSVPLALRLKLLSAALGSFFLASIYPLCLLAYAISFVYVSMTFFPGFVITGLDGIGGLIQWLAYCFSVITMLLIALVMTSPVLPNHSGRIKQDKEEQKDLYHFIDKLATVTGNKGVDTIIFNTDVVVDAYYSNMKDYRSGKLTVDLGLPLLAKLSMQEVTALLCREFAHYSKGSASFYYVFIRSVRQWLFNLANKDNALEQRFDELIARYPRFYFASLKRPFTFFSSLSRQFFSKLEQWLRNITNGSIFEYEILSDKALTHIIGSDGLGPFFEKIIRIDQAHESGIEKIFSGFTKPKNIMDVIDIENFESVSKNDSQKQLILSDNFNGWHMLPNIRSRINQAYNTEIIADFPVKAPFLSLVSEFEKNCELATASFYAGHLTNGKRQSKSSLESSSYSSTKKIQRHEKQSRILKDFTYGLFRSDLVWDFSEVNKDIHASPLKRIAALNKSRAHIQSKIPEYTESIKLFDHYLKNKAEQHFCGWLIKNGSHKRPDASEQERFKREVTKFEHFNVNNLKEYKHFFGLRVMSAVALGKDLKSASTTLNIIDMLSDMSDIQDAIIDADIKCQTLKRLNERQKKGENIHQAAITRLARMTLQTTKNMESVLADLPSELLAYEDSSSIISNSLDIKAPALHLHCKKITDRFYRVRHIFNASNEIISAKIASFVMDFESTKPQKMAQTA